jgi:ribosome biogenesis SPOUT family RNA methylase Rps3
MLEIIALLVLGGLIGDMARRRERTPSLFQAMLVLFWFGGEIAGGVLGYALPRISCRRWATSKASLTSVMKHA